MDMPNLDTATMQYWIERPGELKDFLRGLARTDSEIVYKDIITTKLHPGAEEPLAYLYGDRRITLSKELDKTLSQMQPYQAASLSEIRYVVLKTSARHVVVRRELPELHVFDMSLQEILPIVVGLFKNHFGYGGVIGLMPSAHNVFYYQENDQLFTLLIKPVTNAIWQVSVEEYTDKKTSDMSNIVPPGSRIFIPAATEWRHSSSNQSPPAKTGGLFYWVQKF